MAKVKWGVMGTANIAKWATIPGMKLAESCELYAIAGRNIEKAERFKEDYGFEVAYGSYEELVNDRDVEAVYIPLPNDLHLKWVKDCLRAGKHVICENPWLLMRMKQPICMQQLPSTVFTSWKLMLIFTARMLKVLNRMYRVALLEQLTMLSLRS